MNELLTAMATWLPFTVLPVLLLLLAPTATPGGRRTILALFALATLAAIVAAAVQPAVMRSLEIINPFIDPDLGEPRVFVVDTVNAAAWRYPLVGAGLLAIPTILLFKRLDREPAVPCPVVYGLTLTVWTLAARLLLEKNAAPEGLTWAIGVTVPTFLMLPFVGWWAGRRGASFGKLALIVTLLSVLQRALLVGVGFVATKFDLGTHLDVGAITKVKLPLDEFDFTGPGDHTTEQWLHLILVPQLALWVPGMIVAGLAIGFLPWRIARGKASD